MAPGLRPALGEQTEPVLRQAALHAMPLLQAVPALPRRRSEAVMLLQGVAMMGGLYRALRATGRSDAVAGELVLQAAAAGLAGLPQALRSLYRWYFFARFGPISASIFGDGDPADFAGEARVEGEVYAIDYTGCAIRTLLHRLELGELGPWVCRLDDVQSKALGLGLERTGSLMTGATRCDFRFRKGGPGKPLPKPG
jgi:hypothetical protein